MTLKKPTSVDKATLISQMKALTQEHETAIGHHPAETIAVYRKARDAFMQGQAGASDTDWSRSVGLSLDELSVIHRYMLSSSFISAWYHLYGDKQRRNTAANSCCLLVAGVGLGPEAVYFVFIRG